MANKHIDDTTISLYVGGGLRLKKDLINQVQSHLKECDSCAKRLEKKLDQLSSGDVKNLEEIAWYDEEGIFAIIEWDYKNKKLIRKEDIGLERVVPIGDAHLVDADLRTIPQIVKTVYESTLDNYPDIEVYKKINAFCMGNMLPDYPRDKPFDEKIIINFYYLKD